MAGGGAEGGGETLDLVVDVTASPPVVRVKGVLDIATAGRLRSQLTRLVYEGESALVLDLSGVSFVDSTALGVIARCAQKCRVVVRDASPQVRRLFTITMLDSILELEP